jgi:hypothetical protein
MIYHDLSLHHFASLFSQGSSAALPNLRLASNAGNKWIATSEGLANFRHVQLERITDIEIIWDHVFHVGQIFYPLTSTHEGIGFLHFRDFIVRHCRATLLGRCNPI